MLKKNLLAVFIIGLLFTFTSSLDAQDKQEEINETKMTMQDEDMQKCMDKIAADSTTRIQMMNKMMEHAKGDTDNMMQMCKMMMDNPEMHKMMMKMMHNDGMMEGGMMNHDKMDKKNCCNKSMENKIMNDSTKTMDKSDHESHH